MNSNQKGMFIPTSQVWDVSDVYKTEGIDKGLQELLVRMYQNLSSMAMVINKKDTGLYPTEEYVCGRMYYPKPGLTSASSQTPKLRQVLRKVINWDATLPNATSATKAHGINFDANTVPTDLYAISYDPVAFKTIRLPWVADLGDNISLWLDGTNVNIKTFATDRRNFTITNIVIEYLKF
jgi:hypothetical protein